MVRQGKPSIVPDGRTRFGRRLIALDCTAPTRFRSQKSVNFTRNVVLKTNNSGDAQSQVVDLST
jgi:hypothetical protein